MISSLRTACVRLVHSNITRHNSYGQNSLFTNITRSNTEERISLFTNLIRSNTQGQISLFSTRASYKKPQATVGSDEAVGMSNSTSSSSRLKREDYRHTKHDSAFSPWKLLIGASDWKDHALGKEGAEKYRTQNLPNRVSCPGVYELGITIIQSSRDSRKLNSSSVVPVYLGQAENVRTRLQQYGRDGSHLENGYSHDDLTDFQIVSSIKGPGLFSESFSRGMGIACRFAPLESKEDAEKTEDKLLYKFDYAWNKDRNGARRRDDPLKALERREKASSFSLLAKKYLFIHQKQVGIKIRSCEPLPSKNGSKFPNSGNNFSFFKTLRIKRLQPEPIQHGYGDDCSDICGVAIGQGSVCTKPPVKGRKRCAEHKGMRVNGYTSKLNTENTTPSFPASMGSCTVSDEDCAEIQNQRLSNITSTHQTPCTREQSSAPICGVVLHHGSICTTAPVKGRKRCAAHKGMRVNGYISKSNIVGKEPSTHASVSSDQDCVSIQNHRLSRETHEPCTTGTRLTRILLLFVELSWNGSPHRRKHFQGNKRYLHHKGQKIH